MATTTKNLNNFVNIAESNYRRTSISSKTDKIALCQNAYDQIFNSKAYSWTVSDYSEVVQDYSAIPLPEDFDYIIDDEQYTITIGDRSDGVITRAVNIIPKSASNRYSVLSYSNSYDVFAYFDNDFIRCLPNSNINGQKINFTYKKLPERFSSLTDVPQMVQRNHEQVFAMAIAMNSYQASNLSEDERDNYRSLERQYSVALTSMTAKSNNLGGVY